jgi:hypothetical protein
MFKRRHNEAEINRLMREEWLRTKAQGKTRFIRREMLWSIPLWFATVLGERAIIAFSHHSHFSLLSEGFVGFFMFPILLLGTYLNADWTWKDFEKKYPEDSLPPWQA